MLEVVERLPGVQEWMPGIGESQGDGPRKMRKVKKKQEHSAINTKNVSMDISAFRTFVQSQGWSLGAEKESQVGHQCAVTDGPSQVFVNFSAKGKITPQGKEGKLLTEIQAWVQKYERERPSIVASSPSSVSQPTSNPTQGQREETMPFPMLPPSLENKQSAQRRIRNSLHREEPVLDWIYEHIGQQVYEFLPNHARATYLSGVMVLLTVKKEEGQLHLPDYAMIVIPFAQAYEGFIMQLAFQLGLISQEHIQAYATPIAAGRSLQAVRAHFGQTNNKRDMGLVDTLQCAWRDIHDRVIHTDLVYPIRHSCFVVAEQDIWAINRAMRRGFEYLIEYRKFEGDASPSYPTLAKNAPLDVSERSAERSQERYPQEHQVSTHQIPFSLVTAAPSPVEAGKSRIGTDESGKSDYFGPLVISAVYVDEQTEAQLLAEGVRDSKSLADSRVLYLAEIIKALCPCSVVCIEPKHLHELHEESNSDNQILAQGHAQAIAELLERVTCDLVVTDQFGHESLMSDALMVKGCQITLEQRPRAESDSAVAAASIIARAEFLHQIERLSFHLGKTLPKGTSDPLILTIGREIVEKGGKAALAEVAKLHVNVKTTNTILQEEIC